MDHRSIWQVQFSLVCPLVGLLIQVLLIIYVHLFLLFFFIFYCFNKSVAVQLHDGSHAPVTHIGTIHCSPSLILTNVFHILSFNSICYLLHN